MMFLPGDKVACTPLYDPDQTPSGLWIPDIAKERCDQGIVKYVGPKCKFVQPGDYILFSGYTGTLVSLDGEGLLIILSERYAVAKIGPEVTTIPGVYFKGRDGYFNATYESLTEMIARGIHESEWFKKVNSEALKAGKKGWVTSERPATEDYDEED